MFSHSLYLEKGWKIDPKSEESAVLLLIFVIGI